MGSKIMSLIRQIVIQGEVDSGNSSSTPLGISSVFTGASLDILNCGIVFVNVYANVVSAVDGLSIQQSSNGTNWDHTDDYTIAAGATKNFSINPHARYLRVVYTNGAIAQGSFRLQTICKSQNAKASSHRIKDTIIGDDDCVLIKAALTGENGNGDWHNVKTTSDGNLTISNNSDGLAIAKGDVTGHSYVHKFGSVPDFDSSDGQVTVWDGAEDGAAWEKMVYTYSLTADIQYVSSSNASDTQQVKVQGLDSGFNLVTQLVTLTGQTSATLSTSLIRVFRMKNNGSTDFAGQVFASTSVAAATGIPTTNSVRCIIQPENNQTEMAIYTVPVGKTAYLRSWYASSAGANKTTNIIVRLRAREHGGVWQLKHKMSWNGEIPYQHKYDEPQKFEEKVDIEITCELTAVGVTGAAVSAGFDIVLVDD